MAEQRPGRALLDDLGACGGARRPGVEPVRHRRPLRAGGARRVQGHRDLACRPHAHPRDAVARGREGTARRPRARGPRAGVLLGVDARPGRRPSEGGRADLGAPLRSGRRPRRAPRQGREHPGDAVRDPAPDRALRRALRRGGEAPRREDGLRVHAAGRERPRPRDRAGGRAGRRRAERCAVHRHLAHGEARHLGGRPSRRPRPPVRLGRAQRRPVGEHARPGRRDDQPPGVARRGRVPHPRLRSRRPRRRLRRPVGRRGSLARSCVLSRSTRSSTARTRRAPRSSGTDPGGVGPWSDLRRPIRLPHHLGVRHRADDRADLRLHVRLDGRLRRAAVLLAPDEGRPRFPARRTRAPAPPG